MKKRVLMGAIFAAAVLGSAFGVVGCGGKSESGNGGSGGGSGGGSTHSHTAATEWSYDEYYHFHEASCNIVAHRFDVQEHEGDDCFCGYSKGGTGSPDKPSGGASELGAALSDSGKLTFSKIAGASKYVLTVTYPDGSEKDYDIASTKASVELETLEAGAFPVGKSTLRLVAYELDKIDIDGEQIEQEVPMSGIAESYRVVKAGGAYTFAALAYSDEFIKLGGFVCDDEDSKAFTYEFALNGNAATSFNIANYAKAANGSIKFYKTDEGRDLEDTTAQYGSFELSATKVQRGSNMFYARITSGGETRDYDLCVYGVVSVTIDRYALEFTTTEGGLRTYDMRQIGDPISTTDRGIVAQDVFFDGVGDGDLARDGTYTVIERGDVVVSADGADSSYAIKVYFYDGDVVKADCEEYAAYAQMFRITEYANAITLNTLFSAEGTVIVPYAIVGKPVISAAFQGTDGVTEVVVAEGATAFVASFQLCMGITDIYLPSTIVGMEQFSFGGDALIKSIPDNAVIHCAFSSSAASGFTFKWNYIAGTTRAYSTVYNSVYDGETTPVVPTVSSGLKYRLDDRELTVVGISLDFNGVVPATAKYDDGSTYPVTAIESLCYADGSSYSGDLVIGSGVKNIAAGAFGASRTNRIKSVKVADGNDAFTVDGGVLYTFDRKRVLLATDGDIFVSTLTESIDDGAFGTSGGRVYMKTEIAYAWGGNVTVVYGAYKTVENDVEYNVFSQGGMYGDGPYAEAVAYHGDGGEVTIASEIDGSPVTEFASFLLKDVEVTSLNIPGFVADGSNPVFGLFGDGYTNDTVTRLVVTGDSQNVVHFIQAFTQLTSVQITDNSMYSANGGVVYNTAFNKTVEYVLPSLSGAVTVEFGTISINMSAFAGTSITSVSLPDGLAEIGSEAFRDCRMLTTVNIPSTVTYIGTFAFYGCTSLENVSLPSTAAAITFDIASYGDNPYRGVFSCCAKLKTLSFDGTLSMLEQVLGIADMTLSSYITTVRCSDGNYTVEY